MGRRYSHKGELSEEKAPDLAQEQAWCLRENASHVMCLVRRVAQGVKKASRGLNN